MNPKNILLRMVVLIATMMSAIGANAQEAYACYTSSNTTLTFYYDNLRSTRTQTTYDLNTGSHDAGWDKDGTKSYVTKVVFDPSFAGARPTSTYGWFNDMWNLQSIEGMSYLNTSEVTNMGWMFYFCLNLKSLDVSQFNTAKVTDMTCMFEACNYITTFDLSNWTTSNVTEMGSMFSQCFDLQTIYVGDGWSTAAVEYGTSMFYNCTSLVGGQGTTYDANHVDKEYAHIDGGSNNPGYFTKGSEAYACYTSANKTLTFYYDRLRSTRSNTYDLNTDNSNPAWYDNVTNASVTKVVFDSSFANARPTNTFGWFSGMRQLQTITDMNYLNTSNVTNMIAMFRDCESLTTLDLSNFNTSKVTNMNAMFYNCSNLRTIYVGNGWSSATVTSSAMMFTNCTSLVGGKNTTWKSANPTDKTYARIDGGTSNPGYFTEKPKEAYACYTSENTTLTFYYDNQRVSRSNTYNLNAGGTSPVWMTNGTYDNVTKVVFDPSFADARPTTTFSWLYGMTKLKTIEGMSYLNTSEVTNMSFMFYYCSGLTSLDLSNFNTSKVAQMDNMFGECSDLQTIYVGDGWNTEAVTSSSNMFYNCTSLVGGKNTAWNASNPKDMTYAHIDGGSSNPGYFTYKKPSGIATSLHQVTSDKQQVQSDEWYTIDGRKLNGMPAKKGVYIHNGRAVVL